MNKLIYILTGLMFLFVTTSFAPPVGEMSRWGIIITPCEWCGATNGIQVHHSYPQHVWPELAHDTNLMVCFCQRCHFVVGHKCNWTNVFTNVKAVIREGKK